MKKFIIAILAITTLSASAQGNNFSLRDIFGGSKNSDTTTQTDESGSQQTGDVLGAIGGFLGNVLQSDKFSLDDLVGNWAYRSPAVSFASDNALKKIGGAAAASTVEGQLQPYYDRFGLNNLVMTVDTDHNFTMQVKAFALQGKIEKNVDDNGYTTFNFMAFNKIKIGKVKARVTKAGNQLNVTFDVSKVVKVLRQVSKVMNNTEISALVSLLSSYDGLYVGFKLQRQQ